MVIIKCELRSPHSASASLWTGKPNWLWSQCKSGFPACNCAMWNLWSCMDFCIINSAFLWSHSTLKCILAWIFATATSFILFTWNFFSSTCFCAVSTLIFATSENLSMMFLDFVDEGHVGVLVVRLDDPA